MTYFERENVSSKINLSTYILNPQLIMIENVVASYDWVGEQFYGLDTLLNAKIR